MRRTHDKGFTLTELMVALTLLGVVLAMSYEGYRAVYKSQEVSDRQAVLAREIAQPLDTFEDTISQNTRIENPTAYSASFVTDRNNDNILERHIISAGVDGRLIDQIWIIDNMGNNVSLQLTHVWSTANVNQARAIPLFRYYSESSVTSGSVEIANMANVPADARMVYVTVVATYTGKDLRDTRKVWMRNR